MKIKQLPDGTYMVTPDMAVFETLSLARDYINTKTT